MTANEWQRVGWLAVIYLAILEATSWLFATGSSCLVQAQNYGPYYAEHQECPPFHVFLIKHGASILEKFGDPEWVIAVFTVILAFATYFLWRATRQLVVGADRTAERQLRAYVFITDDCKMTIDLTAHRTSALIKLRNSGKTPAYEFSTWLGGGDALFEAIPFPSATKPLAERSAASIMGPGEGVTIHSTNNPIQPSVLQAIRDGHLGMFIWGGADYTDAFGKRWEFVFRMRISGPEESVDGTKLIWGLKPHPVGYSERKIRKP